MIVPLSKLYSSLMGSKQQNVALTVASPSSVTPVFGTAYQSPDPAKQAFVAVTVDVNHTITLVGTMSDEVQLRIGPDNTVGNVNSATAQIVGKYKKSVTGIAVMVGAAIGQSGQLSALLPAGWYYAVLKISGTSSSISTSYVQPVSITAT